MTLNYTPVYRRNHGVALIDDVKYSGEMRQAAVKSRKLETFLLLLVNRLQSVLSGSTATGTTTISGVEKSASLVNDRCLNVDSRPPGCGT